jgi:hypothetical protein
MRPWNVSMKARRILVFVLVIASVFALASVRLSKGEPRKAPKPMLVYNVQ